MVDLPELSDTRTCLVACECANLMVHRCSQRTWKSNFRTALIARAYQLNGVELALRPRVHVMRGYMKLRVSEHTKQIDYDIFTVVESAVSTEWTHHVQAAAACVRLNCVPTVRVFKQATPFHWNPDWSTDTAKALAKECYRGEPLYPILADALQDAGCEYEPALRSLRQEACTRAHWAVMELLNI